MIFPILMPIALWVVLVFDVLSFRGLERFGRVPKDRSLEDKSSTFLKVAVAFEVWQLLVSQTQPYHASSVELASLASSASGFDK